MSNHTNSTVANKAMVLRTPFWTDTAELIIYVKPLVSRSKAARNLPLPKSFYINARKNNGRDKFLNAVSFVLWRLPN